MEVKNEKIAAYEVGGLKKLSCDHNYDSNPSINQKQKKRLLIYNNNAMKKTTEKLKTVFFHKMVSVEKIRFLYHFFYFFEVIKLV